MVAPLAAIALAWEGRDWGSSRLLHGRRVRVGFGRLARTMPLGSAASGVVLVGMGIVTLVTAVTGPSMSSSGWRETMAAFLQHASSVTARALSWLPGWAVLAVLAVLAAALPWQARRSRRRAEEAGDPEAADAGIPEMSTAGARAGQEAVTRER
jgi:cytochrome c-type biogenesis protein